jgi:hypothetical protein
VDEAHMSLPWPVPALAGVELGLGGDASCIVATSLTPVRIQAGVNRL